MTLTPEMRTSANRRWIVGLVSFVLTSLIATWIFAAERKSRDLPGWGEVILCGVCMGLFSVLLYNCRSGKTFVECMHVSLMPIAVLYIVLGLLLLVGMIASLVLKGVEAMVLLPLVLLVYFGGAFYLLLAAAVLSLSSFVGGAFIYGAMRIMKLAADIGRAHS